MDLKNLTKTYTNGEVTVIWKPGLCIHSAKCWKFDDSLPEVFNPAKSPWINPDGADTQRIIEQVNKCPSGALSYRMNEIPEKVATAEGETTGPVVEVSPNGPLLIHGSITVKLHDGTETNREKLTAFCRCGHSANKPFCDGSHRTAGFKD